MRKLLTVALLLCFVLSLNGFSQSNNATLGGTVQDPTGAFIPGVTITATNTGTGIVSTVLSNESGAYQFASLQPGSYDVKADLTGFQPAIAKAFELGGAQQARFNFELKVGNATTTVDVTASADTLLATSSNSVGAILPEYKVRDLPLATRDVFGLVAATAGVQSSGGFVANFAGGRISEVNTTRDGINVSAGRFEDGAWSVTYSSPDLVEEVKVVVAPVDAQASRGSGQVSMVTRSGTNAIRGSAFWVNHNSSLDASTWFNNFNGVSKSYDNRNQFGGRIGGPIVKNKTFFFALFEGQRDLKRENATGTTLTSLARQGIFRYFPGVDNGNANATVPTVDRSGNPVKPATAKGDLAAIDLFGNCAGVANCLTFRDPLRPAINTSAFMQEELRRMPIPNQFTGGDGLNTAQIAFVRRVEGLDLANGNGTDVDRNQYNLRIDHNFNARHKLSVTGTREKTWGGAGQAGQRSWPDGFDGIAIKRPDVYIISFTSTLSSSLLNEFRAARKRSIDGQFPPGNRPGPLGDEARKFVPTANGAPFRVTFGTGIPAFVSYGGFGAWRSHVSPLYTLADDLSWSKGKHAFKGGYELRLGYSSGFGDPSFTPGVSIGAGSNPVATLDSTIYPNLNPTPAGTARSLVTDLAGSVSSVNEAFGLLSATQPTLLGTPINPVKRFTDYQNEMSTYFKDDWKFRSDLTLNLGVHWEYFGQPYEKTGLAARVIGNDETALTKISCTSSPGTIGFTSACSNLTQVQFVGKNSPNPTISTNMKGDDYNNWAPAVGLSWNVPWFGKGKTVARSGYGISYSGSLRNFITVDSTMGTVPGMNLVSGGSGITYTVPTGVNTNLSNLTLPIPFPAGTSTTSPFLVQTNDRTLTLSTYNRVTPYTQNWNVEIQRELAKNTTIEVRYVGTKGSKLWGTLNLNQVDALRRNKDLYDAFNAVRAGGESPLLTQILMGNAFGSGTTVNGTTWTGAMAVRTNTTTRAQIANGNVGAFVSGFNTSQTGITGAAASTGAVLRKNGFPDNYIVTNPQYSSVSMLDNLGNSNYHSLQLQFTKRLTKGFTNTTTWTWSKAMGDSDTDGGASYRDPSNRSIEYSNLGFDRTHQITSNGTYELPFGTGHFLLGGAPGWAQEVVHGWQLGGLMNYNTGSPLNVSSGNSTISTTGAQANLVGAFPKGTGTVTKVANGVVYFDGYTQTDDPYKSQVSALNGLNTAYTNKAIVSPSGQIVLINPQPGDVGTLGQNTIKGPASIGLDMNLIKRFKIHESKEFEFRLDAVNVLNHPNFGSPAVAINGSNNFGRITSASGTRSFVVNSRINF